MDTSRFVAATPWVFLGLLASVAFANWSTTSILLLAPVFLVGAILVWRRDPGREVFGALAGFSLLPLILLTREPPCLASGFCASDPVSSWLYAITALVLAGTVLVVRHRGAA